MAARTLEDLAVYDHNHPGRDRKLPYIWHITHESGASTYGRTKEKEPALGVWGRIGVVDGIGRPVRWQIVPNEVALHKFREVQQSRRWSKSLPVEEQNGHNAFPGNDIRIDPEISISDIPAEDLIHPDYDEEADEELVGHIVAVQTAFKDARSALDSTEKAVERFFTAVADADESDPDQAEELAILARLHQKKFRKFNDAINGAEVAFEAIIENLEGA